MLNYLIILSLKARYRNIGYRRKLLTFAVLIFCYLLYFYGERNIISILDSFMSTSPDITVLMFFLKLFPFIIFFDILLKLIIKNNSIYLSSLQTLPISKKEWSIYILFCNIFTFWNFYLFILLLPILTRFATFDEIATISILLCVSSVLNNVVCLWLSNYYSKLWIKTLFIGIFYLTLLGSIFLYIHNNAFYNNFILSYILILLFLFLAMILFLYLIKQKKIYDVDNLNKQHLIINQGIYLSLLKMEFIYLFRSKRLLILFLFATFGSLLVLILIGDRESIFFTHLFIFIILLFPSSILGQYFFAVEANFFNGIWTKPISIMRLLETKYLFFVIITGTFSAIPLLFVIFYHLNIFSFFSIVFFIMFIFNLLLFPMALYAKRLDLNSSPFLNSQGLTKIPYFYIIILTLLASFFLFFIRAKINNEWIFGSIISAISLIFFFLRKQFLFIVCSLFIKRRHTIMYRYMNA